MGKIKNILLVIIVLFFAFSTISYATDDFSDEVVFEFDTEESPVFSKEIPQAIELWHYSAGHWGSDLRIYDTELDKYTYNLDLLGQELAKKSNNNSKKEWIIPIDDATVLKLQELKLNEGNAVVKLKSSEEDVKINDLIITNDDLAGYQPVFKVDLVKKQIKVICYPHFNILTLYHKYDEVHDDTQGRLENTIIPVIDEKYGYNVYSMFDVNNTHYGASKATHNAVKLDNNNDIYYGDISIRGAETYIDGGTGLDYKVYVNDEHKRNFTDLKSTQLTIGNQTFHAAGAVGIHFDYPLEIELYMQNAVDFKILYKGSDVTDNSGSPIPYLENSSVQVTLENTSSIKNVTRFEWYQKVDGNWQLIETRNDKSSVSLSTNNDLLPIRLVAVKPDSTTVLEEHTFYLSQISTVSGSADFTLNYNELSKAFTYKLNGSGGVNLSSGSAPGRSGEWTESLNAIYNITYSVVQFLTDNHRISNNTIDAWTNSATANPTLDFSTDRQYFGQQPDKGLFGVDGSRDATFNVQGSGSSDRDYRYLVSVRKSRKNAKGETEYYYVDEWRDSSKDIFYSPSINTAINVRVNTYNGSRSNPSVSLSDREVSGSDYQRNFVWEGPRLPFFVSRTMTDMGANVEVPGKYERYYQAENSGSVTFEPVAKSFYDPFHKKTFNVNGMYINAPYTLTKETHTKYLNTNMMTLKSGYFYEVTGDFKATVTTRAYVKGRSTSDYDDTGHQSLVNKVKSDFTIVSNIPTVRNGKDRNTYLPTYTNQAGNIPVNISNNTTRSVSMVSHNASSYKRNMEKSDAYMYEEYVSNKSLSDLSSLGIYSGFNLSKAREEIYYVEETTVINFSIPLHKKYIDINTKDAEYYIGAYIKGIEVDRNYTERNSDLNMSSIPSNFLSSSQRNKYYASKYYYKFLISGDMYDDAYINN